MNFKHKNTTYAPFNSHKKIKVQVVPVFRFWLYIFIERFIHVFKISSIKYQTSFLKSPINLIGLKLNFVFKKNN